MRTNRFLPSLSLLSASALVALAFIAAGSSLRGQTIQSGRVVRISPVQPPIVAQISLTAKSDTFSRSAGQKGKIIVARNGGDLEVDLTVNLAITGSAVNGEDYAPVSTTVSIPAGVDEAKFKIAPLATGRTGKVKIVVLPGDGYAVSGTSKAKVKIVD